MVINKKRLLIVKHSHSKKADLSLSTNAIVILILAITILGLGLTFVRGLFKQAETKVAETFSATELANPPTMDKPVTITPGLLNIRLGKSGKAVIANFNPKPVDRYCQLKGGTGIAIPPDGLTATGSKLYASGSGAKIPREGTNTWVLAIEALSPGTGLYSFQVDCCNSNTGGTGCDTITPDTVKYSIDLVVHVTT